jgi:WD40 repeat protein
MRRASAAVALLVFCLTMAAGIASGADRAARILAADTHLSLFAFCADGRTIVGREKNVTWLIDWPSGAARKAEPPATGPPRPPCPTYALGYSPDGKWWATPGPLGVVLLRDGASGEVSKTLPAHLDGANSAMFSPDGRYLASSGGDNDVHVWDARTWEHKTTITSLTHTPFALGWAPDGSVLYVAGASGTVTAWSAATWTLLHTSAPQRLALNRLAVSPDGKMIATAGFNPDGESYPSSVFILDARSLTVRDSIPMPTSLGALAFSPDGRSLLGLVRDQAGITVWPMER